MADDIDAVVFELADQRFGFPTMDVGEVALCVRIVSIPQAPAIVEGIINLRGTVVPVLDIRARFGIPAKPVEPSDRLIVATVGGRTVAVRVDRAVDLIRCTAAQIEDGRRAVPGNDLIAGVAKLADGIVLIHDLRAFLTQGETAALDMWLAQAGAPGAQP